jgi:hypothetical protein
VQQTVKTITQKYFIVFLSLCILCEPLCNKQNSKVKVSPANNEIKARSKISDFASLIKYDLVGQLPDS